MYFQANTLKINYYYYLKHLITGFGFHGGSIKFYLTKYKYIYIYI